MARMTTTEISAGAGRALAGEPVVSVRALVKRYGGAGSYPAVAGIDLEVAGGEIFAFLGPNGAGKPVVIGRSAGGACSAGCS
jgi:ABC-2 type transport system ATP-binding protein